MTLGPFGKVAHALSTTIVASGNNSGGLLTLAPPYLCSLLRGTRDNPLPALRARLDVRIVATRVGTVVPVIRFPLNVDRGWFPLNVNRGRVRVMTVRVEKRIPEERNTDEY